MNEWMMQLLCVCHRGGDRWAVALVDVVVVGVRLSLSPIGLPDRGMD